MNSADEEHPDIMLHRYQFQLITDPRFLARDSGRSYQ
jgi:hypothetical protein